MTLYYSPITKQALKQLDLWKLFQPVKGKYRFKEFCEILGYQKMDVGMLEERIQAQNHLIHILLKQLKAARVREAIRDLTDGHELVRGRRTTYRLIRGELVEKQKRRL